MSIPDPADPVDRRSRSHRDPERSGATSLVLASSGPAAGLGTEAPGRRVRVLADPRHFRDLLLAERPGIVVCSKIEPDPGHPVHLVTVRGIGYRLDAPQR